MHKIHHRKQGTAPGCTVGLMSINTIIILITNIIICILSFHPLKQDTSPAGFRVQNQLYHELELQNRHLVLYFFSDSLQEQGVCNLHNSM